MKFLNLDLRSLVIGFLLATVAFLVFKGSPSQAQTGSPTLISAGDGGIYIQRNNYVIFCDKGKVQSQAGCQF
jgi:hypothetical protein